MNSNITQEEANEMRRRAIERAEELKISEVVMYLLKTDPSITDYPEGEQSLRHNISRPLHGSGLIMYADVKGPQVYVLSLAFADNRTKRVFRYEKSYSEEKVTIFRDGPWVQLLMGAAESLKYERDNKSIIRILHDFSPIEGPQIS